MGKNKRAMKRHTENEFKKQVYMNREAKPGCHEFVLVLDHLKPNFNLGKIFRSAQVFGATEIHVVGTKYFDPKPAKGALKYVPVRFHAEVGPALEDLKSRGYTIFAMAADSRSFLGRAELPAKSAFIFGNEGLGIRFNPEAYGIQTLAIPQFGVMESLNVSVAASITMFEYVRQHGGEVPEVAPAYWRKQLDWADSIASTSPDA